MLGDVLKGSQMITLDEKIERTQRLLRRIEEDRPYMKARLAGLGDDHRQRASEYADELRAQAIAELTRLIEQRGSDADLTIPQPAD
jgi:hypothetical protein